MYICAQLLGAMFGAFLVWLAYKKHFDATEDADSKLAVFCTAPNIRSYWYNVLTEAIGTYVLALAVLYMAQPEVGLGALNALPVAIVVLGLGLSLGGPTGYAINPARDLGPRIMHFFLPIPGKRDSDWKYSWVPVLGPLVGASLAAAMFLIFKGAVGNSRLAYCVVIFVVSFTEFIKIFTKNGILLLFLTTIYKLALRFK